MEPRLIKGIHAEYVAATWSGKDTSGVRVVGKCVLVLTDECATKTTGGIEIPEDVVERMSMAAESGVLVACSPGAFLLNEDMTPWIGEKPKPGDRVYIEKYAGKQVKGRDGKTYRIMDYSCIGATYEQEESVSREAVGNGSTGLGQHHPQALGAALTLTEPQPAQLDRDPNYSTGK